MKTQIKEQYDFGSRSIYQIPFETVEVEKWFSGLHSQQFVVPWQLEQQELNDKKEIKVE